LTYSYQHNISETLIWCLWFCNRSWNLADG